MERRKKRKIILIMALGAFIMCAICRADEEKRSKLIRKVSNEVEGEVSAVSKDHIAVVYNRDIAKGIEYEMSFPIDSKVVFEHKKNLREISVGDRVRISFDEETIQEEGKEFNRRAPKKLSFVSPAVKKPVVNEEISENDEEGVFPIKGLKLE